MGGALPNGGMRCCRTFVKKILKTVLLFQKNPFHPSLRLHQLEGKLKGYWSISIDLQYRIIFRFLDNGDALFASVGTHAIYE